MAIPTPYNISIPSSSLQTLHDKLTLHTFPNELSNSGWDLGAPLADVKRLTNYWLNTFSWRTVEAELNTLPQYKTSVAVAGFGDIGLHYVHQLSGRKGAIPLLFVHGWPGSYLEVKKLLPLLRGDDGGPAFDIVAPSLPNFGWSDGVGKRGFALGQYAEACHGLMVKLGYGEYVTQGGDWGYYITRCIGKLYPKHCLASHVNMIRANPPTPTRNPLLTLRHALTPYTAREKAGLTRQSWFLREGSGYRFLQSTKPQTLGYSLSDSPVALLAWLLEKLHDWTDGYPWTDEEILTWVSIYWFSAAGPAASLRIYYESTHDSNPITTREAMATYTPGVKLGLAYFPKELGVVPKSWGRTLGPVVWESEHEVGGHFAAWERPEAVAGDLRKMFGKGGPCAGVVKGRTGYSEAAKL